MGPASCFYFTENLVFGGVELRFCCSSQTSSMHQSLNKEGGGPVLRPSAVREGLWGAQHEKQATLGPFGQVLQGETAWCLSCQSCDMVTISLPMALQSEWSLGAGLELVHKQLPSGDLP